MTAKTRDEILAAIVDAEMYVKELQWDLERPDMTNPFRGARMDKEAREAFHKKHPEGYSRLNYANATQEGLNQLDARFPEIDGFAGVQTQQSF